jgi:tRNA dimethylallyltransferase
MMQAGLIDETRDLLDSGVFEKNSTAAQAIGYKELLSYFNNEKTLISAVEDLKMATRRYAKRQLTWFSSHGNVNWLVADGKALTELADEAEQIIKEKM